ncbi:MAG: site-specific integrase [Bacilli bacterium]
MKHSSRRDENWCVSPDPSTPQTRIVEEFTIYLAHQRGLSMGTRNWYRLVATRFLDFSQAEWSEDARKVSIAQDRVAKFLQTEAKHRSTGSLHNVTVALRSLLRCLFVTGRLPQSLVGAVLPTPGWRDSGPLIHSPSEAQVADLLNSCDLRSPAGCRDFAILLIMSRLGLRSGEVAVFCRPKVQSFAAKKYTCRCIFTHTAMLDMEPPWA